ncbi:MAG: LysR family transcriptional regulator [Trueperaceae bacterium]
MSEVNPPVERLPDAEHLLTLLAVADAGNESSAAEILGVGQSSINRRLAGLQQHTTTPLTKRTAAGTRLTPAGAALLPYAREVREALRSAARLLAPGATAPLRLSLGVSPHLLPRLAAALAGAALAPEPLDLALTERSSSDLLAAVRGAELDAALTLWAPAGTEPGLNAVQLGTDRVVLAAPAGVGIVAGGKADLAALRDSVLLLPGTSTLTDRGRAFARLVGLQQERVVKLSGPAAVRAAVLAGNGVGVLLASYVSAEAAAAWLVTAPLSESSEGSNLTSSANGDNAAELRTKAAGLDTVSVWLLANDSVPEEPMRRLLELAKGAVEGTALR